MNFPCSFFIQKERNHLRQERVQVWGGDNLKWRNQERAERENTKTEDIAQASAKTA